MLFKYNKWVIILEIIKVFSCLELAKSFLDNMEQTILTVPIEKYREKKKKYRKNIEWSHTSVFSFF